MAKSSLSDVNHSFVIEGRSTVLRDQIDLDYFLVAHRADVLCRSPQWSEALLAGPTALLRWATPLSLRNAILHLSSIDPPPIEDPSQMSCTNIYREMHPSTSYVIRSAMTINDDTPLTRRSFMDQLTRSSPLRRIPLASRGLPPVSIQPTPSQSASVGHNNNTAVK